MCIRVWVRYRGGEGTWRQATASTYQSSNYSNEWSSLMYVPGLFLLLLVVVVVPIYIDNRHASSFLKDTGVFYGEFKLGLYEERGQHVTGFFPRMTSDHTMKTGNAPLMYTLPAVVYSFQVVSPDKVIRSQPGHQHLVGTSSTV